MLTFQNSLAFDRAVKKRKTHDCLAIVGSKICFHLSENRIHDAGRTGHATHGLGLPATAGAQTRLSFNDVVHFNCIH
jgi:hypothetical protein